VSSDDAASPWRAMARSPWRFLLSSRPWRSLAYLACGVFGALPAVALGLWVYASGAWWTVPVAVCLVVLVAFVGAGPIEAVELRRLRVLDPHLRPLGHPPAGSGWRGAGPRLTDAATWRRFGYALLFTTVLAAGGAVVVATMAGLLFAPAGVVLAVVLDSDMTAGVGSTAAAVGVWLLMVVLTEYAATTVAGVQAAVARRTLTDRDAPLAAQVRELARSRTRLVDAFEAERSRIERDLHDGAQQRLVALVMTLGMSELTLAEPDGDVAPLLAKAREQAEAVLGDLRELIRGIHPRVLTDRGIQAAVAEIGDRCPLPVEVRIDLPGRPARSVESIAYFVVSEALANVVKHARASRVEVVGTATGDRLALTVRDDGAGGADPEGGTGLQGLADRVAVVGGALRLTSPRGGPTELRVELPWHPADFG